MRVLFVYPNSTKSIELPLGIAYLSAMLKTHGHKTSVLDLTWNPTQKQIIQQMKGYDLLAISCNTLEYRISLGIAEIWKKHYKLPVIMGGPKATTEPEQVINNPNIDAICRGEGEEAFLEFVDLYEKHGSLPLRVKNFWVKPYFTVYQNPLRTLNENLDTFPFPDRTLFDKRHMENKYPGCSFLTSRGCPFHCSMCINHYLQKLYKGLGKYVRFRSVDNLLQEIVMVKSNYNLKCILFTDDTFTINRKRLGEFCRRYPKEVDLPFIIMGRCNTVTKSMLEDLSRAGCVQVAFGLESGNPFIRNKVLQRDMSNRQIVDAFKWAHEAKIKTVSFNMIGIPFETRERIFHTVTLNRLANPDLVQTTLLYPFPKTEIRNLAVRYGMLHNPSRLTEYYSGSIIKLPTLSNHELVSLRLMMPFYIHLPRLLHPFTRLLEALLTFTQKTRLSKFLKFAIVAFTKKVLEKGFWKQLRK